MRPALLISALALIACEDLHALRETPSVQASADESARWEIDINRVVDGVYRSYAPRCLDGVRAGHTVEFRNYQPEVPANVTTIAGPEPLYSPNLKRPYNYVASTDPASPVFSFWRHTFTQPGVYDWIDTNQSEPGRKVVDPYYGTVTFIGIDPNSPLGTICVVNEDGTGCEKVCCGQDADCNPPRTHCFRTDVDAVGRCLTPSG